MRGRNMKKSKRNDYLLGGISLFIGVYMILKTVLDIFKEAPNGVLQGGSPVGFVWGISVIVGVICIIAGAVSVYRGKKKH